MQKFAELYRLLWRLSSVSLNIKLIENSCPEYKDE